MSATLVLTQTQQAFHNRDVQGEEQGGEPCREAELYTFDNCSKGLGIKICGGCSLNGEELYGIFVKRIMPGGLADIDGDLQKGDQILEVNGETLEGVTNERAVALLRQASASNHVEMVVARDDAARLEFKEIMERNDGFSFPCTPVPTENSQNSQVRAGTEGHRVSPSNQQSTLLESPSIYSSPQDEAHVATSTPNSGQEPIVNSGMTPKHPQLLKGLVPSMSSTPQNKGSFGSASSGSHMSSMPGVAPSPVAHSSLHNKHHTTTESVFELQSHQRLPKSYTMSQSRKLSLDPDVRLKVTKLNSALRYLGLDPTFEQEVDIRSRLNIDSSGTVPYGEFVNVARDVFRLQLEEKNIDESAMLFVASDFTDIVDPPAFKHEPAETPRNHTQLEQENEDLRQENKQLEVLLREKEDEILRIRKEAQGAIHEQRTLRSKVHLAAQAQKAARDMENDYEEVVHLLEGEIAQLKLQVRKQGEADPVMQRRLAVLTCQLRKAESEKETFKVATEKLLQFAEGMYGTFSDSSSGIMVSKPLSSSAGEIAWGSRPLHVMGKHKAPSHQHISKDAKDVVKSVRSLIDTQPLPFGWEEAYTADGMKYYINHLNQLTVWSHPLSNITHLPTIEDESKKENSEDVAVSGDRTREGDSRREGQTEQLKPST